MTNCINCNIEVEQIGNKPKKFCSDNCRKEHWRKNETIGKETIGNDRIATIEEAIEKEQEKEQEKKEKTMEERYPIEDKEKKEKLIREEFPDWKGYGWCKYCGEKMEFFDGECCSKCVVLKNNMPEWRNR